MKHLKYLVNLSLFSALLFTASCSKIEIDNDYMVGKWSLNYEDERISNDGAIWYTFNSDGSCQKEVYNALGKPGEGTSFLNGTWSIEKDNESGNKLLFIGYMYSDSPSDSESFVITQKSQNTLHIDFYEPPYSSKIIVKYILTRTTL